MSASDCQIECTILHFRIVHPVMDGNPATTLFANISQKSPHIFWLDVRTIPKNLHNLLCQRGLNKFLIKFTIGKIYSYPMDWICPREALVSRPLHCFIGSPPELKA